MKVIQKTLFLFIMTACGQPDSAKLNSAPKVIYVETVDLGTSLQDCFGNNLFHKWSDSLFGLHESKLSYNEDVLKGKHLFLGINSFNTENADDNVEKIRIALVGNLTVANTTVSIQKFVLQDDRKWKAVNGLKHFKTFDRPKDFISPGFLDIDEICEQLIQKAVQASYK